MRDFIEQLESYGVWVADDARPSEINAVYAWAKKQVNAFESGDDEDAENHS